MARLIFQSMSRRTRASSMAVMDMGVQVPVGVSVVGVLVGAGVLVGPLLLGVGERSSVRR